MIVYSLLCRFRELLVLKERELVMNGVQSSSLSKMKMIKNLNGCLVVNTGNIETIILGIYHYLNFGRPVLFIIHYSCNFNFVCVPRY